MFTLSARLYKELVRRAEERTSAYRDRHARSLVSLGMVRRTSRGYHVRDIARRQLRPSFDVRRDPKTGRARCQCEEFEQRVKSEPRFRCAHILAAKYYAESLAAAGVARILKFEARQQTAPKRERRGHPPRDPQQLADYYTWTEVAEALDRVDPRWSQQILLAAPSGHNRVKVIVAITIGRVTKLGNGWGNALTPEGIKKAEDDAMKRAATQFRPVRLELTNPGGGGPAGTSRSNGNVTPITKLRGSPVAKTRNTLITPKQLAAIRTMERHTGRPPDYFSYFIFGCATEALAKRCASALLTFLEEYTVEDGADEHTRALAS